MTTRMGSWPPGRPAMLAQLAGPWWAFLVSGVCWLIVSAVVLRFSIASVAAVGVLLGVVFLLATVSEIAIAAARVGWTWLHLLMSVIFILGAIWSFASPFGAFWALTAVVGLLLILRGSLDLITSIPSREFNPTWWLGLITGILEIVLGFWASQQAFPARAALVIFFVGFFAVFRGISDIVLGFELRSVKHS
jgi:uncharacterized membrane protein HdeD (DUF308 family)